MTEQRIDRVIGRRVWDSRGRPTVEADVILRDGTLGRAIAPAGASRGSREAVDLRDGGAAFGGLGVSRALEGIARRIEPALSGMDVTDQSAIDVRLEELDGTGDFSRLGGNAAIAVSMAALQASAAAAGTSLWALLAGDTRAVLPMPMIQIFGGGAHAARRLDLQDILMMPLCAARFDEAMAISAEIYRHAGLLMAEAGELHGVADEGGWWPDFDSNDAALERAVTAIERAGFRPGEDVALALDVAASELCRDGRYHLEADGAVLETDGMVSLIEAWCARYPIVSVEDPLAEDDDAGMAEITRRIGDRVQIVGDDYLVTSADRIEAAAKLRGCNAVLIKPNQAGTVTRTISALQAARRRGWRTVVSARSGESEDTTIVHLAVGLGADQFKVGSFARSERMAKWNEGVRIEEAMGASAEFAARRALG